MNDEQNTALEVPRYLLVRPRMRVVAFQVAVLLLLLLCVGCVLRTVDRSSRAFLMLFGCACVIVALLQIVWFLARTPRAIVATDEFLGVTFLNGDQRRIVWTSICHAAHSTGLLGMQWRFDLLPQGTFTLRDIGVDGTRWGVLRSVVIHLAGAHGASVLVDPISESVFSKHN